MKLLACVNFIFSLVLSFDLLDYIAEFSPLFKYIQDYGY